MIAADGCGAAAAKALTNFKDIGQDSGQARLTDSLFGGVIDALRGRQISPSFDVLKKRELNTMIPAHSGCEPLFFKSKREASQS
ncbi:MAG TPA: hypothetical protein VGC86_01275 [Afipia sp.]